MTAKASGGLEGRRRSMSDAEYEKLEQYVIRMKRRGYSDKITSASIPLSQEGVRHMVERLRAKGVEGI